MKICVAQTRSASGDILGNISAHLNLIELACGEGADVIFFPELSLTGYEPSIAEDLATAPGDNRFDVFQEISNKRIISIGAGIPIRHPEGVSISMIFFQPYAPRLIHSKKYLHPDEVGFFVSGHHDAELTVKGIAISIGICYEISVPEHVATIGHRGSKYYLASVAKFLRHMEATSRTLAGIAMDKSVTVLMANGVGPCGGDRCAGGSAVWNNRGERVGALNGYDEGVFLFDTETSTFTSKYPVGTLRSGS